ncbi:hypothetical protein [Roseibium sp.]|uniref:hypothetical protein n=1 Tax=Roseibium sp. TaxID=1936156 RepID=UPI003B5236D6
MPELLEKTLGSAGALAAFCLVFLWVVDLALIYKIAATSFAGLALSGLGMHFFLKGRRLTKIRHQQLQRHRSGQTTKG